MIRLANAHIIISREVAALLFSTAQRVNWVYYPQRKTLLIAPAADELFTSLHKTAGSLLKHKNDKGDRSMSVQELLLDHEIDNSDRALDYKADSRLNVLNIYF